MRARLISLLLLVTLALAPASVRAEDWLVYLEGGLESISGGWELRRGQVVFRTSSGTLSSIPAMNVDLPASAFISWQLNGRTEAPPRGPKPEEPQQEGSARIPCTRARVVSISGSETFEVEIDGERETIHVACFDAPESSYSMAHLGFFGRATESAMQSQVKPGGWVCLAEHSPPKRDGAGHRVVHVALEDGRDYAGIAISEGFALLRLGVCSRAASYRQLEDRAIEQERGLWGNAGTRAAFAVVQRSIGVATGGVGGAMPPRRVGGG